VHAASPSSTTARSSNRAGVARLFARNAYTLTATAVDASGQSTAISTQVKAPVTSVDLTQTPPALTINGQSYTMNQLQQIVAPGQ
jgi:hypothetical protein